MATPIYVWADTPPSIQHKILRRAEADIDGLLPTVEPIVDAVRTHGDSALLRYAKEFDGIQFSEANHLKVSPEEFAAADERLDESLKAAIRLCAANVRRFHEAQKNLEKDHWMLEIAPGVWAGEQINAIPSVGLYVPRGKGAFPSVMYMLCTPAIVAGVPKIIVCTPPNEEGLIDDASLFAAKLCGITDIYKLGGAQAIAAMAYGTATIPKSQKFSDPAALTFQLQKGFYSILLIPEYPQGRARLLF